MLFYVIIVVSLWWIGNIEASTSGSDPRKGSIFSSGKFGKLFSYKKLDKGNPDSPEAIPSSSCISTSQERFLEALRDLNFRKIFEDYDEATRVGGEGIKMKVSSEERDAIKAKLYDALAAKQLPSPETMSLVKAYMITVPDFYAIAGATGAYKGDEFEKENLKSICQEIREKSSLRYKSGEDHYKLLNEIVHLRIASEHANVFTLYGRCRFSFDIEIFLAHKNGDVRNFFLAFYAGESIVLDSFTEKEVGGEIERDYGF